MAAIVKKRLLRLGSANWGADAADGTDEWLVRVDEQIDKFAMLALWLAQGDTPRPNNSFKTVGPTFLLCDQLSFQVVNSQRFLWKVLVTWREIKASESITTQTRPAPTTNSTDPANWAPTVTRRPVTMTEPAQELFYEDGYNGPIHDEYTAATTAGDRSPVTNSAKKPFEDNLPLHQRKASLWTIRWLRASISQALINAELTLNDRDVIFSHRGYSVTWLAKTAKLESVQVSQTTWGTTQLWEIVAEILHDRDGHLVTTLDMGMTEQYYPGETYGGATLTTCKSLLIKVQGKQTPEPVLLNGGGRRLDCDDPPKFGKWRDFALEDWAALPVLGGAGGLISNVPPPDP